MGLPNKYTKFLEKQKKDMKREKYLFKVVEKTLLFTGDKDTTKKEVADLVMQELINIKE